MIDIFEKENGKEVGLTPASLENSRNIRSEFTAKYKCQPNGVPQSILVWDRKKPIDFINDGMKGGASGFSKKNESKVLAKTNNPAILRSAAAARGKESRTGDTLSTFPQNIGRIMLDIYAPEKGIVYDPHAGHNSRMQLVFESGRHYYGVDVWKEAMIANRQIRDILLMKHKSSLFVENTPEIKLYEQSSHSVPEISDNFADFSITSPPYWNIEKYGSEDEQLGKSKTYQEFLDKLYLHIKECYRILKPDSYVCYFINDFRDKGVFYPFHIDCYLLHIKAGFIPFNIYVSDLGWTIGAAYLRDIIKRKCLPKRHEYCLVLKK